MMSLVIHGHMRGPTENTSQISFPNAHYLRAPSVLKVLTMPKPYFRKTTQLFLVGSHPINLRIKDYS